MARLRILVACCLTILFSANSIIAAPNIILVLTDDQGYGPVHAHGNEWLRTPHLDDLYQNSTRLTRFLVSPTCSPTRSALMTGRHPLKNGITHTILERERLTLDAKILPQVLKTQGYKSGVFGKWHLGDEDPYQPNQRGFDEAFIHGAGGIGQAYDSSCADAPGNKYFDPVIRHNGVFKQTKGFCTDLFFDAALTWIRQMQQQKTPFFAYIATNAPHGPYVAPAEKAERFRQLGFPDGPAGFYGMVENIDDNVGKLMSQLEKWQLLNDTIIIFMSDNGMAGGGGAVGNKPLGKDASGEAILSWNDGMKGLKGSPDEGGVRVPFFIRWNGHFQSGREIDRIAAHIDVLPTLAELVGAELPVGQVEGRSLLPLLDGRISTTSWPDRMLFTHTGRWPKGSNPDQHQWKGFAVRNQRFRLVGDQLFDMEMDPGQLRDIAAENPEAVSSMRQAFDLFWKQARPMMVNEDVPLSPTRPFWVAFEQQKASGGIPVWNPAY